MKVERWKFEVISFTMDFISNWLFLDRNWLERNGEIYFDQTEFRDILQIYLGSTMFE